MTGAEIGEGNEDAKKHKERLGECGRVGKGRDKGREGRDEGSGHGEAAARDVRAVETCAEAAWALVVVVGGGVVMGRSRRSRASEAEGSKLGRWWRGLRCCLFGLEAWVDAMLSSARASEAERRAARAAGRGWRS